MRLRETANPIAEIICGNNNILGASGRGFSVGADHLTAAIMDGSDTQDLMEIGITNVDHTGAGNTLNLLEITPITGDANSNLNAINIGALTGTAGAAGEVETAINIGDGWDYALTVPDGSAQDNSIALGDAQDAEIVFTGGNLHIILDEVAATYGMHVEMGANSAAQFRVYSANTGNNLYYRTLGIVNANYDGFDLNLSRQ
jgi:hypothetical protein